MKILLASPNILTNPYPVYPLGLDYVAGSIAEEHEVRLADLNTLSLENLDTLLVAFKPQIIGLSCRNIDNMEASGSRYFINEYQKIVARLRANSTALLVCGGSGFTIMPQQILDVLGADYGIVGEGERFGLLVEAVNNGQDPRQIPGVIGAAAKKAIAKPPPWDGRIERKFQPDAEHNRFYLESGGMLNLQSKRGCSFHCIYCSYPHIEGRKHRLIEPGKVAQMACDLQASGARYFFITDSAFNSDIKHSLAVAKAFKALAEGKIEPTTNLLQPIFYVPDAINRQTIESLVTTRLGKRVNCIVGSGGPDEVTSVSKLHARGYTGPLWEHLIR